MTPDTVTLRAVIAGDRYRYIVTAGAYRAETYDYTEALRYFLRWTQPESED